MKEKENESESEALIVKNNNQQDKISPIQIIDKNIIDKYLCCCCDSKYDLTIEEYNLFEKLKNETIISFDESNKEHEKSLNELLENGKDIISNEEIKEDYEYWRILGFQSNNPRTDFRAGGIYSVLFMNYFIRNNNIEVKEMIKLKYFSFGVVCIRITFLVRLFLFLSKKEDVKNQQLTNKIEGCSRKELKAFVYYLSNDNIILLDILSSILIFIKQKYIKEMDENKKELNFLLIDPIIYLGIKCLGKALNNSSKKRNDSLVDLMQNEFNKENQNKLKI